MISNLDDVNSIDTSKVENRLILVSAVNLNNIIEFNIKNNLSQIRAVIYQMENNNQNLSEHNNEYTTVKLLTADEAKHNLNLTHIDSFLGRMPFLSEDQIKKQKVGHLSAIGKGKDFGIFTKDDNSLIGYLQMHEVHFEGKQRLLISWVWISKNIPENVKNEVRSNFRFLMSSANHDDLIASVHTENKPSMSFFNKLGWSIRWIYVF